MLNLDLKQTEAAICAGRLDEAFSLIRKAENRRTRRGQELLSDLAAALLERGREHLASGRLAPAGSDAAKAIECAGQKPDVVELFDAVARARHADGQRRRHADALMNQARRQAAIGENSLAGKIAGAIDMDATVARQMTQQLDVQREVRQATLQKVTELIDDCQYEMAIDRLVAISAGGEQSPQLTSEISRAAAPLIRSARSDLDSGRLDRASSLATRLSPLSKHCPPIMELLEIVARCQRCGQLILSGEYRDATVQLGLLTQMIPDANWVQQARDASSMAIEAITTMQTGPLGLIDGQPLVAATECKPVSHMAATQPWMYSPPAGQPSPVLPDRLLLQVDGFGSVLVLSKDQIHIGAQSDSRGVDVPISTDGIAGSITIRREEDDYLLMSTNPIEINGKLTRKRLLEDQDRISVGRRGRLLFRRPVAASASAILHCDGAPMSRPDIRHIALLGDSMILGPSDASHLILRDQSSSIVLFRSSNGVSLRSLGESASEPVALPLDESIIIGDRRIKLTEFAHGRV